MITTTGPCGAGSSWVVKTPAGRDMEETRRDSQDKAISAVEAFAGNKWSNLFRRGYRTELQRVPKISCVADAKVGQS